MPQWLLALVYAPTKAKAFAHEGASAVCMHLLLLQVFLVHSACICACVACLAVAKAAARPASPMSHFCAGCLRH